MRAYWRSMDRNSLFHRVLSRAPVPAAARLPALFEVSPFLYNTFMKFSRCSCSRAAMISWPSPLRKWNVQAEVKIDLDLRLHIAVCMKVTTRLYRIFADLSRLTPVEEKMSELFRGYILENFRCPMTSRSVLSAFRQRAPAAAARRRCPAGRPALRPSPPRTPPPASWPAPAPPPTPLRSWIRC